MSGGLLAAVVPVSRFALWLGLHLIRRDPGDRLLRPTGLGLVAYVLALAGDLLAQASVPAGGDDWVVDRVRWPLLVVPALCWAAAVPSLLPPESPGRDRLLVFWRPALPAGVLLAAAVAVVGDTVGGDAARDALGGGVLAALLGTVIAAWRGAGGGEGGEGRLPLGAPAVASLFLGLSTGLLLVPGDRLPRIGVVLLIGVDLVWLGIAIARRDAAAGGETLLADASRALAAGPAWLRWLSAGRSGWRSRRRSDRRGR